MGRGEIKPKRGKFVIVNSINRPPLGRLIGVQVVAIATLGSVFYFHGGTVAGLSSVLGGIIFLVPNLFFTWRVFQHQGARAAKKIVDTFYRAEMVKLFMTATLFTLVFVMVEPINPVALFLTFIGTQAMSWLASTQLTHHPKQNV